MAGSFLLSKTSSFTNCSKIDIKTNCSKIVELAFKSATTRTHVGGVLSMSYHSCSGKDLLLLMMIHNGSASSLLHIFTSPNLLIEAPSYDLSIAYIEGNNWCALHLHLDL